MKKLILSIFSICISAAAFSQVGNGGKFIGGSFFYDHEDAGAASYYTYTTGTVQYYRSNLTTLNISPEIGFFVSKRLSLSLQPGYSRVSGTETSNFTSATAPATNFSYSRDYHTDIAGLAINARYYFPLSDKVYLYPQFGISTNHNLNDFNIGSFNAGGGPNLLCFATPKLGFNVGFGNLNYNYNYQTKNSRVNLSLNNSFSFGVNYYWGSN